MAKHRILVVDDNLLNLKLTCKILEFAGYQVDRAINAEAAQEIIAKTPPALILTDIHLPGMDGLALTRILKSDEKTRNIVVVALSASAMAGDSQKGIEAGCDGYISKPMDIHDLPNTVATYLAKAEERQ